MDIEQIRTQHAVGQGSFHSASIRIHALDGTCVRFDYVYDCGALVGSSQTKELTWALKYYQGRPSGGCGDDQRPVIDALVLSHFDRDHMNGAEDLAKSHRIRRIYLPYLSPEELIVQLLHDLNISGAIYPERARGLFELAHGSAAWGAPLTRVGLGEGPLGAKQEGPFFSPDQPEERPYESDNLAGSSRATSAQVWDLGSGASIGGHLDHTHTIGIGTGLRETPFWTMRFWNYRNGDHVAGEVWQALQAVGCPVDEVRTGGSIGKLLQWLALKAQRSSALKAYRDVLNRVARRGQHVPMEGFANLVSLALLSAPASGVHLVSSSDSTIASRTCCHFLDRLIDEKSRGAWLGTGDAPLGEPAVWDDFCSHYGDTLASVQRLWCLIMVQRQSADTPFTIPASMRARALTPSFQWAKAIIMAILDPRCFGKSCQREVDYRSLVKGHGLLTWSGRCTTHEHSIGISGMAKLVTLMSNLREDQAQRVLVEIQPYLANFTIEHAIEVPSASSNGYSVWGEIIRNLESIETRPKVVIARDQAIAMLRVYGFSASIGGCAYDHDVYVQDVRCSKHYSELRLEMVFEPSRLTFAIYPLIKSKGRWKQKREDGIPITTHLNFECFGGGASAFYREWHEQDKLYYQSNDDYDKACDDERRNLYCFGVELALLAEGGATIPTLLEKIASYAIVSHWTNENRGEDIFEKVAKHFDAVLEEIGKSSELNWSAAITQLKRSKRDILALPLSPKSAARFNELTKRPNERYVIAKDLAIQEAKDIISTYGDGVGNLRIELDDFSGCIKGVPVSFVQKWDFRTEAQRATNHLIEKLVRYGYRGVIERGMFTAQESQVCVELESPDALLRLAFSSGLIEAIFLRYTLDYRADGMSAEEDSYSLNFVKYTFRADEADGGGLSILSVIDILTEHLRTNEYEMAMVILQENGISSTKTSASGQKRRYTVTPDCYEDRNKGVGGN